MRLRLVIFLAVALLLAADMASAQTFQFQLGFKALAEQIPETVGSPLEAEHWAANHDSLQKTSKGLMVWRSSDNFTCFTDGSTSWIVGPFGVQSRPNDQRFEWEGDYEANRVGKALKNVLNETILYAVGRAEGFEITNERITISWLDSNWNKDILQQHQYKAVAALADWIVANTGLRPSITIRSMSNLGAGNYLDSTTPASVVEAIGNKKMGQGEWLTQAKFTVVGKLY